MNSNVPTKSARLTCATRRSYRSMNHMTQNASSATARCRRFTAFLISSLREKVSTLQINSYQQPVDNLVRNIITRSRHAQVIHMLDRLGTLLARALRGSERALKRIARSVAIVIGISLCVPMSHATSGSIEAIHPKDYVRLALPKKEAKCLSRLIGKESAWNHKAVGNLSSPTKSYVYGLLQLKNPIVKDKSPIEQIHFGLKYIDHRYQGNACNAWKHWKDKGWH
jgi:hypothetical protein